MERNLKNSKDSVAKRAVDYRDNENYRDNAKGLGGNEVDEIVGRSISELASYKNDQEINEHRLALFKCFEVFYLDEEPDHLKIAQALDKAWKSAEFALSAPKFACLKEYVNQDIKKIVDLNSVGNDTSSAYKSFNTGVKSALDSFLKR